GSPIADMSNGGLRLLHACEITRCVAATASTRSGFTLSTRIFYSRRRVESVNPDPVGHRCRITSPCYFDRERMRTGSKTCHGEHHGWRHFRRRVSIDFLFEFAIDVYLCNPGPLIAKSNPLRTLSSESERRAGAWIDGQFCRTAAVYQRGVGQPYARILDCAARLFKTVCCEID